MRYFIPALLLLTACAEVPDPVPDVHSPMREVRAQANDDCKSTAIDWDMSVVTTKFPFNHYWTITFKCEADGRVVGPYHFIEKR